MSTNMDCAVNPIVSVRRDWLRQLLMRARHAKAHATIGGITYKTLTDIVNEVSRIVDPVSVSDKERIAELEARVKELEAWQRLGPDREIVWNSDTDKFETRDIVPKAECLPYDEKRRLHRESFNGGLESAARAIDRAAEEAVSAYQRAKFGSPTAFHRAEEVDVLRNLAAKIRSFKHKKEC